MINCVTLESVVRKQDGRYEVGLPWIPEATLTNTNEALSRKRLEKIQYNTIQILLSTSHGGFSETNINSTGNNKKKTQELSINNY